MKIHTTTSGQATGSLRPLAQAVLFRLLLTLTLSGTAMPDRVAARSWTGDGALILGGGGVYSGGYKLWSDADNWSPHGVPQNGEDLWFSGSRFTDPPPMVNDLTNLTVRTLGFSINSAADINWTLYGNTLGISAAVFNTNYFDCQVYIHCGLKLAGNVTITDGSTYDNFPVFGTETMAMHLTGPIELNGHNLVLYANSDYWAYGHMYVEGGISGVGNVLAIAGGFDFGSYYPGALEFVGTGNDFSGTLTINSRTDSTIVFNVSPGVVVSDRLVITNVGAVRLDRSEQIGDGATVRLTDGAKLSLNDHAESILNLELATDSNDSRPTIVDAGTGGLLGLYGNITTICNNNAQTPAIKGKITLTSGEHTFNTSGTAYTGLDMQAQILGDGNFSKTGNSALLLTGSNSCNSTISVMQGILDVRHYYALGDTAGPTQLFGGALLLRNVAIAGETLFALGQGTGGVLPGSVLTSVGACSWSGPVLLNTNLVVSGDMTFSGVISGAGGLGCFGITTVHLTGNNTYTGTNYISGATLQVDGLQPLNPIDLYDQARLQGSGTVGNINVKGSSTTIAPGSSPGILTCSNFNAGAIGSGILEIELNGTTPGSGYDQINANGTVNLTGLSLSATLNFSPAQEDSFTIINNDGTDPVIGTFPGLRQNKQVRIGGESFHVNYAGGTGNDLVLTRLGHDIVWTNNVSGDWNDPANWSPNIVPGVNDTAFIFKGVTVTLNSDVEVYSFIFGDAASSPTLTGTGTLTISDTATWERGTMSGSGRTIIATGATLSIINASAALGLSSRTLENGGTVLWTGASLSLLNSALITNRPGALFEIQGTGGLIAGGGAISRFDNAGIYRKSVNTGTNSLGQVPFNNTGTMEIQAGTLLSSGSFLNDGVVNLSPGTTNRIAANGSGSGTFNAPATALVEWTAGTFTLLNGAQLNGAGLYRINGGNVTCDTDIAVANLELVIATLNGTGTLTVSNLMNWTGGIMSGSGRTIIPTGATLNAANAAAVSLTGGRTLENGGTVLWTGANISLLNSAVFTNRTGALIEIQGAGAPIFGGGAIPRFDNAGIFRKSVNTGTTTFGQVPFNNYGTVEIQTGTLLYTGSFTNSGAVNLSAGTTNRLTANGSASGTFNTPATALVEWTGGTFTLDSGAKLNGAGLYRINGGSVTFATDVVVANLDLILATLSGTGKLTVSNLMNWTGGTMSGSGRTIIAAGATLNIPSGVALNPRTLENGGTVLWTGIGNITFTSAVITNRAGAVFETRGAGALSFGSGSGSRFDNAGTFRKSINTGTTTAVGGVPFNNYGAVEIQTGILAANGGYTSTASSLLNCAIGGTTVGTGYGRLQVAGAVTLNGNLGISLANGFVPVTNDTFTVVSAGTRSGTFANFYFPSNEVTMQMSNTANSVIVNVSAVLVVPPPMLHIEGISSFNARLYWSTNYPAYHLEYNPSLDTTNWAASALTPVVTATNFVVTNSLFGVQKYYRLSRVPALYTPPPAILGWNNVVTNLISGSQTFYRLASP